ncbi:OmpH family outer membrane protein [Robiginitomaculum antarcticum]|uniref:OmpH family outer membrane protein n=1 Tax=Robiginitomaculum antarcticum TaxID=437507 RepID=UPI000363D1AB|nr:OmpH family outer membrane protein [Robiginitomaculum antarcticum]
MFIRQFSRIALITIATAFFAAVANAQSVLVVDQSRVMRDSNVGKHITNQMKAIGTQMDSEMQQAEAPIKSELDNLRASMSGMTAEQLRARPDLAQRASDLQEKVGKSQVEKQYKQQEFVVTQKKAAAKVNEKLAKILEAVVSERGAQIVVDRSMVIYGAPTVDITADVIRRLDQEMRTVPVTRERLPRKS